MKTYPVPTSVRIEPTAGASFEALVLGLVSHGVWVQTSEVLRFRQPVTLVFDPNEPHALSSRAEVVSVVDGALGFELADDASERLKSVLGAWADGRAAELHGDTVPPPPPRDPGATPRGSGLRPLTGKLVVIVEDEAAVARILQVALEKRGAVVAICRNGTEALEFMRQHRVSAVLLDWMLPGTSGDGVLTALRAHSEPPPVAVVSGVMSLGSTRQEAKQRGAQAVFTKPFRVSQICEWLEENAR